MAPGRMINFVKHHSTWCYSTEHHSSLHIFNVIQGKVSFCSVWWALFYKVSFCRMLLGRMIKLAKHYYIGHYSIEHHSSQYILVCNSGESVILLGVVERHSTKCHSAECRGASLASTKCLIEGFESNWVCDALKKNFSVDVTNKVEIRGPYSQQFTLFLPSKLECLFLAGFSSLA